MTQSEKDSRAVRQRDPFSEEAESAKNKKGVWSVEKWELKKQLPS